MRKTTDGGPRPSAYGRGMTTNSHTRRGSHFRRWGLVTAGLTLAGWLVAALVLEGYALAAVVLLVAAVVAAILIPLAAIFEEENALPFAQRNKRYEP